MVQGQCRTEEFDHYMRRQQGMVAEVNRNKELREIVREIDQTGQGLTEWEAEFVGDLVERDQRMFSERQETVIRRIHGARLGGGA